ncbi:MAG: ATP-dependent Clp protease ATP-binding subunit [Patescibacteria group bacterium]|nr:ATP-dependent Clp protease ATP-binding subunit [Patescibacteria group bacterium]
MEYVKPQRARLYGAVRLGRIFPLPVVRFLALAGLVAAVAFFGFWLVGADQARSWHAAIIAMVVAYAAFAYAVFFESYLSISSVPEPEEENLAEYLDYPALGVVVAYRGVDLAALLLPMLAVPGVSFVLARMGTTPREFRNALTDYLKSDPGTAAGGEMPTFLRACIEDRRLRSRSLVLSWRDLFFGLATVSPFLKRFLLDARLEPADLRTLLDWQEESERKRNRRRQFWSKYNLMRSRSIGRDWASGYAPHLEKYAIEVNRYVDRNFSPHLYGRVAETEAIERILARDGKNNVILVGEAGVGKMLTVSALAARIALGEVLAALSHKRVLQLETGALTSGLTGDGEIETRLQAVLNDAVRAGNIILLIENIQDLFNDSHAAGTIDATQVLLPYLASSRLQIIGLTTYEGYHESIVTHADLARLFEKVELREPIKENVYAILRDVIPQIEGHDRVWVLYQAVKAAVELSDRYIKNAPFPEKTIDLLQEAAVLAGARGEGVVTAAHIEEVVRERTRIPVGEMAGNEKDVLLNLETTLHERVVGQDEAISAIANAMRRARSGISSAKKPIGSFLFFGPTGVGKTETAKALALAYFGSEKRMVRFDMSEYQLPDSLHRLIGHDSEAGALTTAIMDNPFSLLLLDEIEKAHPDILNVFLQVLDDGRLTDALGRTVDFTNTIIIATSNAGAELIRESVARGDGSEGGLQERILEALQTQGVFRPEFLNRFDAIVMFKPLTGDQTNQVARLLLADLNSRLKEKSITVVADEQVLAKLVSVGFDPEFGMRPLRRAVQDRVENLVAHKILAGELKNGDTLTLTPSDIGA